MRLTCGAGRGLRSRFVLAVLLLSELWGLGYLCAQQTTVTLSTSANPVVFGQPLTLTATVSPAGSGSVTFYDGTTVLGIWALASGKAAMTSSLLASGTRSVRAYYAGDLTHAPGTSAVIVETVQTIPADGFGLPVNLNPGINPISTFAVGDFNNDGKTDLALVTDPGVSVLLGNGDGTFQTAVNYAGPTFFVIAVGDFDGDGNADLVVSNASYISVLLGNGDGTFKPPLNSPIPGGGYSFVVGDFNGDGRADLAAEMNGSLTVFLGNGDGTFQPTNVASTLSTAGGTMVVGDFNGDGYADVAVANLDGSVSVFLGTGKGAFRPAVNYGNSIAASIVAGDFNGDGKLDLAVAVLGSMTVLLGKGDGTFESAANYAIGAQTVPSLAVCDFNGDGKPDLAVAEQTSGAIDVFYGNGDGTFTGPAPSSPLPSFPLVYPLPATFLAVADFNGDGKPDIALVIDEADIGPHAADNGLSVLLGGVGRATAATLSSSANPAYMGESVILTAAISPAGATGSVAFYDGSTAVGATVLANVTASLVTSKLSVGSHSLTAVYGGDTYHDGSTSPVLNQTITQGTATTTTLSSSGAQIAYGQSVTFTAKVSPTSADGSVAFYEGANIIGTQGLIARQAVFTTSMLTAGAHFIHAYYGGSANYTPSASSSSTTVVVSAVVANGLQTAVTYPVGGTGVALVEGDFNGDGKTDFAVAMNGSVSVLLGNGDGTFRAPLNTSTGVNPNGLAAGDFNSDGRADLLVTSGSQVTVLLGNGDGTFRAGVSYSVSSSGGVVVGDFNVDGKADFAGYSGGAEIFLGNGDGTFQPGAIWLIDGFAAGADFNGDGIPDFVAITSSGVVVYLSHGDGTFTAMPPFDAPFTVWSDFGVSTGGVVGFAAGDFNGDGRADLAIEIYTPESYEYSASYSLGVIFGRGDGTFGSGVTVSGVAEIGCCVSFPWDLGDFNGDGITDLVVNGTVYLGRANGTFDSTGFVSSNFPRGAFVIGEFNGDGVPDLAALSGTTVSVTLGKTIPASTTVLTSSPNPSSYGQSVTFTATVSPSTATGTVVFSGIGSAPLVNGQASVTTSSLPIGSNPVTATYSGDANLFTSTSPVLTQTVNMVTTSMTLTSSANTASLGESVRLTATVSPPLTSGNIVFNDGQAFLGLNSLSAGKASILVSTLSVGSHALTAVFDSDSIHQSSTSSVLTETINPGVPENLTLTSSANPATFGQSVTLTATALGSGSVTFFDGETILGVSAVTGGKASLTTDMLASGKRLLRAYYSGDGTYSPGFSPALVQTVNTLPAYGFQTPVNYATGSFVTSTAVGDFNGDGKADIAVSDSSHVYLFLGNGDGTFRLSTTINSTPSIVSIAVGDFNADGNADLLLAASDANRGSVLSVFLGNGDGTFQPQLSDVVSPSQSIAVADIKGDGIEDVVLGLYYDGDEGGVSVIPGNGDGTFGMMYGVLGSSTTNPRALLVGDFNGDGVADFAFANGSNHSVGIILGQSNGSFFFVNEVDYDTGSTAPPVSIASADFNGDGNVDITVANSDGSVSVLLGNGDGTFQRAVNYSVGIPAAGVGIAVADFNGDGNADIVVANPKGVAVLAGNGDGTFQAPVFYGAGSSSVVVADFNGDGCSDLLVANTNSPGFSVLLGSATPAVANAASLTVGSPLSPGSLAVVYGTFADSPSTASGLAIRFGNGLTAPILAVSNGKATFEVPWELAGQSQTTLALTVNGRTSAAQTVMLSSFAPGIFTVSGDGTGQAAIYDSSNRLVDAYNPAVAGSTIVQIYCTGLGAVSGPPATGFPAQSNPLSSTITTPNVTIGLENATVLFSGLVPGLVGVYQVNAVVPSFVSMGVAVPVTISWEGITSNAPTIAVQ